MGILARPGRSVVEKPGTGKNACPYLSTSRRAASRADSLGRIPSQKPRRRFADDRDRLNDRTLETEMIGPAVLSRMEQPDEFSRVRIN